MDNFVAIDFETANHNLTSVCAVGCVKVCNGIIRDRYYTLVRPYPDFYSSRFTAIHGLSGKDTSDSMTFDKVWEELCGFIGDMPLVAHNARFDRNVLYAALKHYGILRPVNAFYCTVEAARRSIPRTLCASFSLPSLADFMGIPFNNHHNALADAEACAKIAMTLL